MKYTYEEACKQVNTFIDNLNQTIDSDIKSIVAALLMHGYKTTASCAGHPEQSPIRCYPFIILNYPAPVDEWEETAREAWLQQNIQQQQRLAKDIEKFYQHHDASSFNSQLVINSFGAGIAELRSFGAEFIELENNVYQVHAQYLDELKAFAEYLKNKK